MRRGLRLAVATAAGAATLVFAGSALAANTASIAVSHTPLVLAGSKSTTIHINIPQSTDPIAAINIYAAPGYGATLGQPAQTSIGDVTATAFSHDNGLTLPLSGTVVTDDPSKHVPDSTQCTGGPSTAVWNLNLSVAGQQIVLPVYVNQTAGAEQALGSYKITVCLPPPDVPIGTPGRAAQGAQVLDVQFTVNGIFTTPTGAGVFKWEALFTPYKPGIGVVNKLGTFESRAFVPDPIGLPIKATYKKSTRKWTLSGTATEGGQPLSGFTLTVYRGLSAASLKKVSSVKTSATGTWKTSGRLVPRKTTYFQVSATAPERDFTAQGCQSPIAAVAPGGCVKATLSAWSAKSVVVKVKP